MRLRGVAFALLTGPILGSVALPSQPGERVLRFPENGSLGAVMVCKAEDAPLDGAEWLSVMPRLTRWHRWGRAQGERRIPEGYLVALVMHEGQWNDLSPLAALPPNSLDYLSINCSVPMEEPGDVCLEHIVALRGLTGLELSGAKLTGAGFARLREMQGLERLRISQKGLGPDAMEHIGAIASLKGLGLWSAEDIGPGGMRIPASLDKLEYVSLSGRAFGKDTMESLLGRPHLTAIGFRSRNLDEEGIALIWEMGTIERLSVDEVFTEEMLRALASITTLRQLTITDLDVPGDLGVLTKLPVLGSLSLYCRHLNDDMLAPLASAPSLEDFKACSMKMGGALGLTDEGLAHLAAIPNLESVNLYEGRYTDAGLRNLAKAKNLRRVEMPNNRDFTDMGLGYLAEAPNIECLYLRGNVATDAGIAHIARMTNLRELEFLASTELTDEGLAILADMKQLRSLRYFSRKATSSGVNALNGLSNLVELRAVCMQQGDAPLDIPGMTRLERLEICPLSDEDIECLTGLKHLRCLKVSGTNTVTDVGLMKLAQIESLGHLEMGPEKDLLTTKEGVKRLQEARPSLDYYTWAPFK